MRILVTGATGFIGSAFVRRALASGHEVGALVMPQEAVPPALSGRQVTCFRGSLEDPPWGEIERFGPQAVVHLAWIATPGVYLESPANDDFRDWSLAFVRRAREAGAGYVLGVGTCIEYRIDGGVLSEESTPIEPLSRYSRAKNEFRLAVEAEGGAGFGWGRVFYPYGAGEPAAKLCSSIAAKIAGGERIVLKTPGSTKDYIHVDDLAAAILLTVDRRFEGPINWGTGSGISVRGIAETIGETIGRGELVEDAADAVVDPLGYVVADAGRLHSLGWEPRVTIREGIRELCESVLNRASGSGQPEDKR